MSEAALLKNIKTIAQSIELVYGNDDYTSATILSFKLLFGVLDLILLRSEGKTPKDHTERFRMLEKDHQELYVFLDKHFKIYRDTYSLTIDKETCDDVRKGIKAIMERHGIAS
jgi:hypothetical protein